MISAELGVPVFDVSRSARAPRLRDAISTDRLVWIALALVWMLGHGFVGIEHDARIYMGRALADIDPFGVGRDMMFELDGQSGFTVYRYLAKALVERLGLGPTTVVLTIVNLIVWFVAIVVFVRTLVPERAALLVLLVAFVLPRFYTPWHLIDGAESTPVPRPLAEAGVLFALAALCRGRSLVACGGLIVAALVHPIMAAPGFVVLLAVGASRDRRWVAGAIAAAVLILVAAALGVPVVSRLFAVFDPAWRAILVERNPYLWMRLWPLETYGMLVVQVTTILIAAAFVEGRARLVLVCAVATGAAGCLASLMFGDGLSNVLVVQAQLWRALWVPAVLAPVAAGLCVLRLPACGRAGDVTLALLALAWVAMEWMPLGPSVSLAALACFWLHRRYRLAFSDRSARAIVVVCAALVLLFAAIEIAILYKVLATKPAGAPIPWAPTWAIGVTIGSSGAWIVPAVSLAYAWWRWRDAPATRLVAAFAVAGLAALTATQWNSRQPFQAANDGGRRMPELREMLASRPGEVLWLRRDEVWSWLGRPNWDGYTHGAGIVFSRPLALKWYERSKAVVDHGLADASLLNPWTRNGPLGQVDLAKADIASFCRRPDAPAWIVAPLEAGRDAPGLKGLRVWAPGLVDWRLGSSDAGFQWTSYDRFAVIPCASAPPRA